MLLDKPKAAVTEQYPIQSRDDAGSDEQTLLIVDDSEDNLLALQGLFANTYRVITTTDPYKAIRLAEFDDVDLVLLDIDMPVMNGYKVCQSLKHNPLTEHIPVIFVTGQSDQESEVRGLQNGAVDYVTKPVNFEILTARVKNHMLMAYYRKQLENISCTDGLTGIANRRQFDTMLYQFFYASKRRLEPFSLLLIDIDNFKLFNDTYGHLKGDKCLKKVAMSIHKASMRTSDFAARFGGEEFALLLSNTDGQGAALVARHVLTEVQNLAIEHASSADHRTVTVSIGIAVFDPSARNQAVKQSEPSKIIELADKHLYRAKSLGKNCFSIQSPSDG